MTNPPIKQLSGRKNSVIGGKEAAVMGKEISRPLFTLRPAVFADEGNEDARSVIRHDNALCRLS